MRIFLIENVLRCADYQVDELYKMAECMWETGLQSQGFQVQLVV